MKKYEWISFEGYLNSDIANELDISIFSVNGYMKSEFFVEKKHRVSIPYYNVHLFDKINGTNFSKENEWKGVTLISEEGFEYIKDRVEEKRSEVKGIEKCDASDSFAGTDSCVNNDKLNEVYNNIKLKLLEIESWIDELNPRLYEVPKVEVERKWRIFNESDVRYIRESKKTLEALAKEFRCSIGAIQQIKKRVTYKWVK